MATRHLVVGLDGSAGSQAAAQWCATMAPLLDADVTAVHALPPLIAFMPQPMGASAPPAYDERLRDELVDALEGWCAPLRDAGVEYHAQVVDGSAAETLMRIADQINADLVVVGRRGHGGFAKLLLGSVPHQLTHHCDRPVLVVPHG
jgi:nucleotide-binding universal stress UspA family protein